MAAPTFVGPRPAPAPAVDKAGADRASRVFGGVCISVLVLLALVWILPLVWAAVTSLRPEGEITADPTSWWSAHWTLDAYRNVIDAGNMTTWYLNSFVVSAATAALTVLVCSMAGMAVSRTRFRGRRALFALISAGLFIPPQVLILPMFKEFNGLHLLNTYWG